MIKVTSHKMKTTFKMEGVSRLRLHDAWYNRPRSKGFSSSRPRDNRPLTVLHFSVRSSRSSTFIPYYMKFLRHFYFANLKWPYFAENRCHLIFAISQKYRDLVRVFVPNISLFTGTCRKKTIKSTRPTSELLQWSITITFY